MQTEAMTQRNDVKVYALCVTALYLKFFVISMIQAKKSFKTGNRAPEDGKLPLAKGAPMQKFFVEDFDVEEDEELEKARDAEQRWRRLCQNDVESVPFAMGVFVAGLFAQSNAQVGCALMIAYTISRYAFSVTYAFGLQPHRAIMYMSGVFCIFGSAINTLLTFLQ